jgi:hypothetical protein
MEYRRTHGSDEYFENLYWCAFLLNLVGDPSDVPMMWEAKHIDFDTGAGFDVQFLLGASVEPTFDYLLHHGYDDLSGNSKSSRSWRKTSVRGLTSDEGISTASDKDSPSAFLR